MTSAAVSRTNMPLRTVPCPPTPAAIMAITTTSVAIESTCVITRWRESRNRSSISQANAAPTSTSSGSSGIRSAAVGMVICMSGSLAAVARRALQLGSGDLGRPVGDRRFHQVDQRLGVDAQYQHAGGEDAQHDRFAEVDVFHLRYVRVADLAPDHALHQPQRVTGADYQRGGRREGDQRVLLEARQDHHEFAD